MLRFRKTKTDAVAGFLGTQTEFTGKLAFSGVVHLDGSFEGGLYLGTLENNGVGLASFHDLESMVPEGLAAELEEVTAGIIAGDIQTQP